VGDDPVGLEAPAGPPSTPASLDDVVASAQSNNPAIAAAQDGVRAAEEGVRRARAEGAPTLAIVADASTVRDAFLPGYRADGASIGVQGRWPIFTGGLTAGKVAEASADRAAAEAALDQARDQTQEAAIDAWQALRTADAVSDAARDQSTAAESALYSVRNEVRVGVKPTLDLLDAEREALAARIAVAQAQGARLVAAYRLKAVIGE
jgi:outer membrane protein